MATFVGWVVIIGLGLYGLKALYDKYGNNDKG